MPEYIDFTGIEASFEDETDKDETIRALRTEVSILQKRLNEAGELLHERQVTIQRLENAV